MELTRSLQKCRSSTLRRRCDIATSALRLMLKRSSRHKSSCLISAVSAHELVTNSLAVLPARRTSATRAVVVSHIVAVVHVTRVRHRSLRRIASAEIRIHQLKRTPQTAVVKVGRLTSHCRRRRAARWPGASAGLRPGSRAACITASVTASRRLQFTTRSGLLIGGNRRAASASAHGPWPRSLVCDPLGRRIGVLRDPHVSAAHLRANLIGHRPPITDLDCCGANRMC